MWVLSVTVAAGMVMAFLIGWFTAKSSESEQRYRLELAENRAVTQKNAAVEALDRESSRREELERANNRLVSELAALATRPPTVIDQGPTIRAIADAISQIAYPGGVAGTGEDDTPVDQRSLSYSRVMPSTTLTEEQQWFPDVEMDSWLEGMDGFPTKGGWVNRSTNSQAPLPDGQHPVHRLLDNGSVERMDGQPMFRAGDGQAATPPGGVE